MKNIALGFLCLIGFLTQAQHTISGTFSPAENYKWVVAYQLTSGSQVYIADTAVLNGNFTLNIKENAGTGTYRLTYGVPQEELYFDIIYNGKEDIKLAFNETQGVSFIASEENKLFNNYFKEINSCEQEIISFYSAQKPNTTALEQLGKSLQQIQATYENNSKGFICHNYIIANSPYIPTPTETAQEYVLNKKKTYFNKIDFTNSILQASDFLTNKVINYVLTALPLKELSDTETETIYQQNIKKVNSLTQNIDPKYTTNLYYLLWKKLSENNLNKTSDFVFNSYLRKLATQTSNQKIITNIQNYNRLRFGTTAPEITWQENGATKKLSELPASENYIIVFWSSGCPHCLKEVPELHKKLANNTSVKVLAVGFEDNDVNWKIESAKLPDFSHALALGKWQNKYVNIYGVSHTPTYFILDKDKKIIGKPEDYNDVLAFFND